MGYGKATPVEPTHIIEAITDVEMEIDRAINKFPGNKYNFAALLEEVGELSQALMEHSRTGGKDERFTPAFIYKEAVQVAAMAIRIAVQGSHEYKYKGLLQAKK